MKTINDFIAYVDKSRDCGGNEVYHCVFTTEDCGFVICEGEDFYAVKWNDSTREAKFFKSEASLAGNHPTHIVDFKKEIDPFIPEDKKHPLESVFSDVLAQVTDGKGVERHGKTEDGKDLTFSEQPLMVITRYVGNGYPLGQAMKKLSEVPGILKSKGRDAAYKEILGAIAYAAAAALYIKEE